MTSALVECVPNFSEGRDRATIDALRDALTGVPGVRLLDVQSDAAHHRSVFTFVAPPAAAAEAAFRATRVAAERIDLTAHRGEHPRMGATDVVPFVPVQDITMAECAALARSLGERIGTELHIPVFLYATAAARPERERLPDIRKGEFEGLRDRIGSDPAADPDFGPRRIHPTAGATAVGARPFLVAYNIYLDTTDVGTAKQIAREVRTSGGGLPAVQASGFEAGGLAQVSMNLLDIDVTPPAAVYAAVAAAAQRLGVAINRSEIVGLIPERALLGAAGTVLKLPDAAGHVLEAKIREASGPSLDGWLDALAGGAPTPGGGSAAALVAMVARLTIGRKAYAAAEARARAILEEAERLRADLRRLVDEDAAAYAAVSNAYRIPKENPRRAQAIDDALLDAARPPADVARHARRIGELADEIGAIGNTNAASDAKVAGLLARAAREGAEENVRVNLAARNGPA